MDDRKNTLIANFMLGSGTLMLLASYVLPVVDGFIFPDKILYGWDVALFTLAGAMSFLNGKLEAVLAGLFLCNLVLVLGIVLFLIRKNVPGWYKTVLVLSLLYVLSFSFHSMSPGQFDIGFYTYICSFLLVGGASFVTSRHVTQRGNGTDVQIR